MFRVLISQINKYIYIYCLNSQSALQHLRQGITQLTLRYPETEVSGHVFLKLTVFSVVLCCVGSSCEQHELLDSTPSSPGFFCYCYYFNNMKHNSNVPAFLTKLWTLVEDENTNEFICWSQVACVCQAHN